MGSVSVLKIGIGSSACFRVRTDSTGRLSLDALRAELEKALSLGFSPIMIVATAG